jgi:hypothetical protein
MILYVVRHEVYGWVKCAAFTDRAKAQEVVIAARQVQASGTYHIDELEVIGEPVDSYVAIPLCNLKPIGFAYSSYAEAVDCVQSKFDSVEDASAHRLSIDLWGVNGKYMYIIVGADIDLAKPEHFIFKR